MNVTLSADLFDFQEHIQLRRRISFLLLSKIDKSYVIFCFDGNKIVEKENKLGYNTI